MTCLARSLSPVMEEVSAFATCGPAANTASARQTARTAQVQRGNRSCGRPGDMGLTCCDGGWGLGTGEVAVHMNPGCPGALAGTIQPAGEPMSGQPDKRMSAVEKVGASTRNAGRQSPSRASVVTVMPVSAPRGALTGREARDTPGERSRLGVILPRLSRDALAVRGPQSDGCDGCPQGSGKVLRPFRR